MLPWYIDDKICTGCGACENICSNKCIKMKEKGDLHFLYPDVNEDKCNHCGMCEKVCPATSEKEKRGFHMKCYAAWADDKVRYQSSSGGAFTLLAETVLDKGGVVYGAELAADLKVVHTCIDSKEQLVKLRKSKYVQSNMGNTYTKIEMALKEGIVVLFSGCPCQVAGVKQYVSVRK